MFWIGIIIAFSGSILGNLLVGSAFDIANKGYSLYNTSIFIISALISIVIIWFVFKKINQVLKRRKR